MPKKRIDRRQFPLRMQNGDAQQSCQPLPSEIPVVDGIKQNIFSILHKNLGALWLDDQTDDVRKVTDDVFDIIRPHLRTTEPVCPYLVTSPATAEGDGGTSYCSLAEAPKPVSGEVIDRHRVVILRNEVNCRIEHGAESNGHLEYVQTQLDEVLNVD